MVCAAMMMDQKSGVLRIPDIPSAFDEIETVTVPARKVMHNGQIYIVTEFGTFDLFGRKVK